MDVSRIYLGASGLATRNVGSKKCLSSCERWVELAELSPFDFSRVLEQATGMPRQFVTRERMLQAQQLIRETSQSLTEVGYRSRSHFAQVMSARRWRHASFRNAF